MSNIDRTLASRRALKATEKFNKETVADAQLLAAIAEARVAMQAYRNKRP